jgi:hypothetical protein
MLLHHEAMDSLVSRIDEFKYKGHGKHSQGEGEGLFFVDTTISGVKVATLEDVKLTYL